MSTIKSPADKKKLSLERDRRNRFGENAKSSRKNIPRSKRRSHQAERRSANAPLRAVQGKVSEDSAVLAELQAHNNIIAKHRESFKKSSDRPLGVVLKSKGKAAKNVH